jgi:malate dehydrogenase (oxaloacetate-decarboxylating)(NADP+)
MRRALEILQREAPWLEVDGEMHGDIALDGEARKALMPDSTLQGDANLLVTSVIGQCFAANSHWRK